MPRSLGAILVAIATPTFGQDGPSFDCAGAESTVETLVCEDADLARLDRLVAERYRAALDQVTQLDTGAADAEAALRAYQRGWIKGRDECWKADDVRTCAEAAYLQREGELVARWLLEDPAGIAFWACGGNPANEVVTYLFDTTRPSVRFERGDEIDTGSLAPAGSGSRYEGSFGRYIWIKGDAATYRDPDPDGIEYQCALTRTE